MCDATGTHAKEQQRLTVLTQKQDIGIIMIQAGQDRDKQEALNSELHKFHKYCIDRFGSLEAAFKYIDFNQNGSLSVSEFVYACVTLLEYCDKGRATRLFTIMDADSHNQLISAKEFGITENSPHSPLGDVQGPVSPPGNLQAPVSPQGNVPSPRHFTPTLQDDCMAQGYVGVDVPSLDFGSAYSDDGASDLVTSRPMSPPIARPSTPEKIPTSKAVNLDQIYEASREKCAGRLMRPMTAGSTRTPSAGGFMSRPTSRPTSRPASASRQLRQLL